MASTPLVGLDEAPETDDDDAAELDAPLAASKDLTQADNTPAGFETLPSGPLEIPTQLPPAPEPALANSAAGPVPEMAATPQSEPLAEPWEATIAPGETLANGASSQDSSPGNDPEIGEPTPSPAESAPSPDLGLELVGGIEATWGPTNAPSFFNNDIRL
jgi:hypothetical protein